ncbi:MAG: hypothetical protein IJ676_00930 [Clostridia bacterium]|nr:hypothetical protein [Clostridia bacterium]
MFRKLRRRTAVYQLAVITAVIALVLACSCVFSYDRMISAVNEKLDLVKEMPFSVADSTKKSPDKNARNSLIIKVYSNDKWKLSDNSFYEESTVTKLINKAKEGTGRLKIDNNRIAYSVERDGGDSFYTVYVYDYSADYDSYIFSFMTILITGLTVIAVVSFFLFRFTERNLKPIEDAFERQKELVANASHELKTPLTIINTDLAILNSSQDEFTDEQKKWLNGIQVQVTRMSNMINEMLQLARFEAVREKNFSKINLSQIIEVVTLETEVLAFEKQVEMVSEIKKDVFVTANKEDMEKLAFILVENAIKYTPAGGKITVKLSAERRKAALKVKNTGEGIEREAIPKLFDRFYRCDESHAENGSFGLGLSIAKAIADANNAVLGVDSQVGKYTEFVVELKEA